LHLSNSDDDLRVLWRGTQKKEIVQMTTMFAAAAALTAAILVASAVGTSTVIPAFAQGDDMTGGGNATEGNMTGTDIAGSGMATPPITAS
jgi:hypothetical protein